MEQELRENLARNLRAARKRAKLSGERAARAITKAGLKCSKVRVYSWEKPNPADRRTPPAWALPIIAAAYGCRVGAFFGEQ